MEQPWALLSSGCAAQPCQSFGLESRGRMDEFGVSGRQGWISPSTGIEAGRELCRDSSSLGRLVTPGHKNLAHVLYLTHFGVCDTLPVRTAPLPA